MSGRPGFARSRDAPAALDGHQPHQRRLGRDRAPAPPRCGRGPPARRGRRTRNRPPPRAAPARRRRRARRTSLGRTPRPARRGAVRGRDADEPAPHVLHANGIDTAGSVAAAGRPPSREPIAMSTGRASRADGRKRLAGSGAADGVPEGGAAAVLLRRHHGDGALHTAITAPRRPCSSPTTRTRPALSPPCPTLVRRARAPD